MQLLIFGFPRPQSEFWKCSAHGFIAFGRTRYGIVCRSPRFRGFFGALGYCRNQRFLPFLPNPLQGWWAQMDSDHRPHAYQACALTSWAMSPCVVEVIGFEPMTPCLQGRCSTSWAISPEHTEIPDSLYIIANRSVFVKEKRAEKS